MLLYQLTNLDPNAIYSLAGTQDAVLLRQDAVYGSKSNACVRSHDTKASETTLRVYPWRMNSDASLRFDGRVAIVTGAGGGVMDGTADSSMRV
mgnify:CR=1 FL=1